MGYPCIAEVDILLEKLHYVVVIDVVVHEDVN